MATPEKFRSVTVLSKIPGLIPALSSILPNINFQEINPDTVKQTDFKECEFLIADCRPLAPYLYNLPKVKWVQTTWAGVESLFKCVDKSKPALHYPVARFSGPMFGQIMAEYVVAQLVSFEREFDRVRENQGRREWITEGRINDHRVISDLTIGILGVGSIGLYIAQILKQLGGKVWGLVRDIPGTKSQYIDEYRRTRDLEELLGSCDVLVGILPDTEGTRGLLTADRLRAARAKAPVLINIGRGSLMREEEIVKALDEGLLRVAILDVFTAEPLPQASPLWAHPKVRITPHVSGVTRAIDVAKVFAENLNSWDQGRPFMTKTVDFEKGY